MVGMIASKKRSTLINKAVLLATAKNKLTQFGQKPVRDVGVILGVVQSAGVPEKEVTALAQKIYTDLFIGSGKGDANQARQSWVVASGNNFEDEYFLDAASLLLYMKPGAI